MRKHSTIFDIIKALKGRRFYSERSEQLSLDRVIQIIVSLQTSYLSDEKPIERHLRQLVTTGECYIDADTSVRLNVLKKKQK